MKKTLYTLLVGVLSAASLNGQIDQVSHGPGYASLTFYDITSGNSQERQLDEWDIAFTVPGRSLGILINEGLASGAGATTVSLFYKEGMTYENPDTSGMVRLYNDETNWDNGAFNSVKTAGNALDFGWGSYNISTHVVSGVRAYVLQLRDGSYKKFIIDNYTSNVYTFKYADLDGSNEVVKSISKSDFTGKSMAYFSFASGQTVDLEPASWDMLFTRYIVPLDDGEGGILHYNVTGTLTNIGVEVARVTDVDPATVSYEPYLAELDADNVKIGHDWKSFDLSTFGWAIPPDLVYFVKTNNEELWKIQFLDFEGSSTGIATLEKTYMTILTSAEEHNQIVQSMSVFPNPASREFNLAFELKETSSEAVITIINSLGQVVERNNTNVYTGLNVVRNIGTSLSDGIYHVVLSVGNESISRKLMIVR